MHACCCPLCVCPQERDRALAEAQARVDKRSSEMESARGASELEMQRRELKVGAEREESLMPSCV